MCLFCEENVNVKIAVSMVISYNSSSSPPSVVAEVEPFALCSLIHFRRAFVLQILRLLGYSITSGFSPLRTYRTEWKYLAYT